MKPSDIYEFTLIANEVRRLLVSGDYFKILVSTGLLKIQSEFGKLDGIGTGQGMENTNFSYLEISNKTAALNTVRLFVGDENFIDGITGNIGISSSKAPQSGAFSNTVKTVTSVSAQLLTANAARQYLLIQNKDTTGNIYLNFGAAATIANGIKIAPGGNFEPGVLTTDQIFAIGDIASNAAVLVVEG